MWRLQICIVEAGREALARSGEVAEPCDAGSFRRTLEEPLQPNANTQKPRAFRDALTHCLGQAKLRE